MAIVLAPFPQMKADWRAYPDNIGHKQTPGCFRCHDGLHKAADGKRAIKASDCSSCHTILAQDSGEQLEKLNPRGYQFFHIDAINEDFSTLAPFTRNRNRIVEPFAIAAAFL